jgi:hypothetical protein
MLVFMARCRMPRTLVCWAPRIRTMAGIAGMVGVWLVMSVGVPRGMRGLMRRVRCGPARVLVGIGVGVCESLRSLRLSSDCTVRILGCDDDARLSFDQCQALLSLFNTISQDELRDVLRARVLRVRVLQPNPRFL